MATDNNSGVILIAAACFTALAAILAVGLWSETESQIKLAARQVRLEQAFYVAEGGAERAASCIANSGGNPPGAITGAIGNGTYGASIESTPVGGQTWYTITATGEVGGVKKCVIMTGIRQQSWSRYAMFYNSAVGSIWIRGGECFSGPVHANCYIYLTENPVFEDEVSTTAPTWGPGSATNQVTFMQGWQFNAPSQNMASISFSSLKSNASLVITGLTSITLSGTNLFISNSRQGWNNINYAVSNAGILTNGVIYVVSSGTGTNSGTASIGGTNLDGRLTLVTDYDIYVTNHITYAVYPTNGSDDALGLIARNDVVVRTNAPNNLNLFAHIIAACPTNSYTHGFYVQNYSGRPPSGNLNVYGGIVEFTRGAVGMVSGNGYLKNYVYDTRFATEPPPSYPVITNQYIWGGWQDKTP